MLVSTVLMSAGSTIMEIRGSAEKKSRHRKDIIGQCSLVILQNAVGIHVIPPRNKSGNCGIDKASLFFLSGRQPQII